ncbi:hypothetical protein TCAL_06986 [Tigriopus californicus]|uniref:Pesticin C-terminal domain-containing protein n=1 Tax=Tigriopus californicus TaxID=6832 RepID=A0A553P8K8_TIGCA|nr:uncharacterized protein LOC131878028 [Tigriopus californicus]TRY73997.1 hypothetical protein TCAL_06986 [Tigriopus californicus]|eukprot:TCALIF_06986-PA protein Name:"Protein of unknown function" AED:0.00 eAED:0.00 QI:307/1/1/1/0.75/0.6/5/272/345
MWFLTGLTLVILQLNKAFCYYNEASCVNAGGYCIPTSSPCPGNKFVSGRCPTQPGNIKCCTSIPYDERQCTSEGGHCLNQGDCSGGRQLSGKCPRQPAGVKCCIKSTATTPPGSTGSGSCGSLGGVCQSYTTCSSVSVSGKCPGNSAMRCCLKNVRASVVQKHVSDEEGGIYLTGYIPTPGSGVTIASGVDLGQQGQRELTTRQVPTNIIQKLSPYLGLNTQQKVARAGLSAANLNLSLNEALSLDQAFLNKLLSRIQPYSSRLSDKGQAVLASLYHWCGTAILNNPDQKCYVRGCPNYIKNALGNRIGRDADLKSALQGLKSCMISKGMRSWKVNRINNEIKFL